MPEAISSAGVIVGRLSKSLISLGVILRNPLFTEGTALHGPPRSDI
jgi:hypothetical protein